MSERVLHIYAQAFWHEEAVIVGTREALLALADAINVAVLKDNSDGVERMEAYTADGEGYDVRIRLMDENSMNKLVLPYTDDDANWYDGEQP
jgi:hypothetical protein